MSLMGHINAERDADEWEARRLERIAKARIAMTETCAKHGAVITFQEPPTLATDDQYAAFLSDLEYALRLSNR